MKNPHVLAKVEKTSFRWKKNNTNKKIENDYLTFVTTDYVSFFLLHKANTKEMFAQIWYLQMHAIEMFSVI